MSRSMRSQESVAALALGCLAGLGLPGCGGVEGRPAGVAGYWEGDGHHAEVPMKDSARELTRSADFEFWFRLDRQGRASGEIELVYDAVLTVRGLPQVSVPLAGASVTFAPKVGGKVTDLDPRRRFPLVGIYRPDEKTLTLQIATPQEEREKIEFTLRADPGVSAGIKGVTVPGGGAGAVVQKIPMTPYSPLGAPAPVERREGGPYAARYEESGDRYALEWSAHQVREESRPLELTPELEAALRDLERALDGG